ncbi:agmatinase [Paracoccus methylarcula]|uniref:Agmatinase n=1 Tax=Paracoccus methylarcula TaxID=72022 RepID=A0A422R253_9RHOB|nr:agmatinase [Paracoccus methylarcula]RNF36335.1 agmatinase [Paracoccus methylarcula]
MPSKGDQAFRRKDTTRGRWHEMTYGGALSFLRRNYSRDLDGVDVAVIGVPYDNAVTFRPGCRLGPQAIRAASVQLAELKAFPFGFDPFETLSVVDYGDVHLDPHHPETIRPAIEAQADEILQGDARTLALGGDHSIAYPLLRAQAKKHGPVALIQFDAHCDTWADDGMQFDHGSMFLRAAREGLIDVGKSTQVGLRTFNDEDFGFEILTSPWIHRNGIDAAIQVARERAGDAPVYISFDVDGMDPAFAPGTGTPVPGGLASWQALEFIRGLGGLDLVGLDVVEVSPPYDQSEITAIAAATVAHDWLCLLAKAKGARTVEVGRL